MNERTYAITSLIALYVLNITMCIMIMMPTAQVLELLSNTNYELVKFSDEENTEGQEKPEDNTKNEKTEFQSVTINYQYCTFYKKLSCQQNRELISSFNQDIFTPPPEKGINT